MNKKEDKIKKKWGLAAIAVSIMLSCSLVLLAATMPETQTTPDILSPVGEIDGGNDGDADGDGSVLDWYVTQEISMEDILLGKLGDFAVPSGETGWIEGFLLNYSQVPETVLANNATDWSVSANADGYVDADNVETDLASESGGYFVMEIRHNDTAKDAGSWNHSRFRCRLNITGDETVDNVYEYNNSGTSGDAVVSSETTDYIYIFYWWDDGSNGYRILDDGALYWSIIVEERY